MLAKKQRLSLRSDPSSRYGSVAGAEILTVWVSAVAVQNKRDAGMECKTSGYQIRGPIQAGVVGGVADCPGREKPIDGALLLGGRLDVPSPRSVPTG
ncbi:hypothetical protein CSPX01_07710 [Colletotrichum filicis]|nr:hypothetical protein CSPX01_07710 [Colletotrichum filicis]